MAVFVTGASGFFGSRLVPRLVELGHYVTTYSRAKEKSAEFANLQGVRHVQGDIGDLDRLQEAMKGSNYVFHLAGLVSYRRDAYDALYKANVIGTRTVMQAALKTNIQRVVHLSSIAGMGIPAPGTVGNEDLDYNLQGKGLHYCDTKFLAEIEVFKLVEKGLPAVMLSPGITFGEGDTHPHHHTIFRSISRGVITGYPIGGVTFSDINDVVNTSINAMRLGADGERYVIGSANLKFREASEIVSKVIGGKPPMFPIPGWLSETAGMLCETFCPLFGINPPLTRGVAWLSQRDIFFSSARAIRDLEHEQTPFEETIRRTAYYYLTAIGAAIPPALDHSVRLER